MKNEKDAFAKRLRDAMRAAGHDPRPAVLEPLFNTHYHGRSVTYQAVSGWLRGRALPSQDKLQVLADLLGIEPHYLRFGDAASRSLREKGARWDAELGPDDKEMLAALRRLSAEQRKLVRDIIQAFAGKPGRK